jgi:hypothetical protein
MLGRPVLLSIAAAAIGSVLSATDASAGCFSCGCGTPVVYSYAYASPCAVYAAPPMYVVNQGPAYTMPVPIAAEPTPVYSYPYVGARRYGATAYYGEEPDEADVYPRAYRHHHRHSYGLDYRGYRHHGRPHIGMRHLYGERHRYRAHVPYARMHMQHRMHQMHRMHRMHMPMRPVPGVVHPQGRRQY